MQNKYKKIISTLKLGILFTILSFLLSNPIALAATQTLNNLRTIDFKNDTAITNCEERGVNNKIIIIESRYCPHCKKVIKFLKPLIAKYNLTAKFKILDIIKSSDRRELQAMQFNVRYTPVVVINCYAYVGEKTQAQYDEYLQNVIGESTRPTNS